MSKLTESFRAVRVFNPYNFYGDQPYIAYRPRGDSRSMISPAWMVHKRGTKFEGHWQDNGARAFLLFEYRVTSHPAAKAAALGEAQAWASRRLGVVEWAKDPYGGYGPAEFVKARIAELKAAVKTAEVST